LTKFDDKNVFLFRLVTDVSSCDFGQIKYNSDQAMYLSQLKNPCLTKLSSYLKHDLSYGDLNLLSLLSALFANLFLTDGTYGGGPRLSTGGPCKRPAEKDLVFTL